MLDTYGSTGSFAVPGTDLHYALLGRDLGGGMSTKGELCNPARAFGVSSGIAGTMANVMSGSMYWDVYVLAHELGHSFGVSVFSAVIPKCLIFFELG